MSHPLVDHSDGNRELLSSAVYQGSAALMEQSETRYIISEGASLDEAMAIANEMLNQLRVDYSVVRIVSHCHTHSPVLPVNRSEAGIKLLPFKRSDNATPAEWVVSMWVEVMNP